MKVVPRGTQGNTAVSHHACQDYSPISADRHAIRIFFDE